MKRWISLTVVAAAAVATSLAMGAKRPATPPTRPDKQQGRVDADYVMALSAANEFFEAWRHRDFGGMKLVSPSLLKAKGEDSLRYWLNGLSNPHHQGYEIANGRRLARGRIAFDVKLYEHYTGDRAQLDQPIVSRVILVRVDDEEWLVDAIPPGPGETIPQTKPAQQ